MIPKLCTTMLDQSLLLTPSSLNRRLFALAGTLADNNDGCGEELCADDSRIRNMVVGRSTEEYPESSLGKGVSAEDFNRFMDCVADAEADCL
jgi:hypothetical protein